MPHKHTRKERDESSFNLPPTEIAKPLPVTSISKHKLEKSKQGTWRGNASKAAAPKGSGSKGNAPDEKKNRKRKRQDDKKDDAPRAFKRLIAFAEGKKPRGGLDDGVVLSKKQKKAANAEAAGTSAEPAKAAKQTEKQERDIPTIRPGERLSEFAARVDAALPLGGLVTKTAVKNGKDMLGIKVPQTRKEKKMHKLYEQWRQEERKIQEKREEEAELAEEEEMDDEQGGVKWKIDMEDDAARGKKKKKGKKGRVLGEVGGKEEDPWEELKRKRGEGKIGLHDVAKAPPELIAPTAKLPMVRGAAVNVGDIPKSAGSLRKREELQSLRSDVIASYRKLMDEKRSSRP
ncbi:hypothetical protein BR93DRAFT_957807 [Coniochaeta sp. PMI_546]|nr:hypothetical protein BR93DRAFT_957807 [Coniochaeta sp. PMI_546]